MGSAPAPSAVSRASRITQTLETGPPFGDCRAANVRRGARRTAAEAAALPGNSTETLSGTAEHPRRFPGFPLGQFQLHPK
jgi:hypothetical protein